MFTSRSFSKLDDIPDYSMALLLHDALDAGAPPSMAVPPMTPDEVAASYADRGLRRRCRQRLTSLFRRARAGSSRPAHAHLLVRFAWKDLPRWLVTMCCWSASASSWRRLNRPA